MANVTDADLVALGTQIKSYQDSGRTVWLRYAPEMYVFQTTLVLFWSLTIFLADQARNLVRLRPCSDRVCERMEEDVSSDS